MFKNFLVVRLKDAIYKMFILPMYTVKKAKRDAGPKHVCDGKFRHLHRSIRKYVINLDRAARSTLGFCNSVEIFSPVAPDRRLNGYPVRGAQLFD
jgi:hypothetical protein